MNSTPIAVPQGSDLQPLLAKRVEVRGYFLRPDYKGFPALYESASREDPPRFLLSIPDSMNWTSRLHRQLVVVGIVDELPPFTEEQRKPGHIPQGYPDGVRFIRVETMADAPPK